MDFLFHLLHRYVASTSVSQWEHVDIFHPSHYTGANLFFLLLCEIMNLLTVSVRRVSWKLDLTMMCVLVTFILPYVTIKSIIRSMNVSNSMESVSIIIAMTIFLLAFWRLGMNLPSAKTNEVDSLDEYEETFLDVIPLAFFIRRIGILGVATMSVMSGFGAVYNPYTKLPCFSLPVTQARVRKNEVNLLRSMHLLIAKKKHLRRRKIQHKSIKTTSSVSVFNSLTSMFSFSSENSSSKQDISRLETEIQALEQFHKEMFLEIHECRSELRFSERSKTLLGRFYAICGYILVGYGIYKVLTSSKNIIMRSIKSNSLERSIEIAETITGMELESYVDVRFWLQQVAFVMMAIMVVTSMRGFMKTLLAVFSAWSSYSAARSEILCLILGEIMGLYFVAQVMMWRMELPQDYRKVVTQALGENIEFNFYYRWSDEIFLSSASISTLVLIFLHKTRESRVTDNGD